MATAERGLVAETLSALAAADALLVLTAHHCEELLRHNDDQVAAQRFAFLAWLCTRPHVAWLAAEPHGQSLGHVPHVTAYEVLFASAEVYSDKAVREYVIGSLLRRDAAPIAEWSAFRDLRPILLARLARQREIVSIVHSMDPKLSKETIGTLRCRLARPLNEARRMTRHGQALLERDLHLRGDKKLESASATAGAFLEGVAEDLPLEIPVGSTPIDELIRVQGLDPAAISDQMTFEEVAYLAEFTKKIRLAGTSVGVAATELDGIRIEAVPTCDIQLALRLARVRSGARAAGSDLTDAYLASLAFYFDLVIVDKRTEELMRQVKDLPQFRGRLGQVRKVRSFTQLPGLLSTGP